MPYCHARQETAVLPGNPGEGAGVGQGGRPPGRRSAVTLTTIPPPMLQLGDDR